MACVGGLEGSEALDDGVDGFVEGGSASRDADGFGLGKPRRLQFGIALDLKNMDTQGRGLFRELARVVAVSPADDDDMVALATEVFEGGLALFRGMADRINEAHLARCEALFDRGDESQGHLDGLRGLRDDTETWMRRKLIQIGLRKHHNGLRMIAN